jgi:hypothetical protein
MSFTAIDTLPGWKAKSTIDTAVTDDVGHDTICALADETVAPVVLRVLPQE